MKAVIMSFVLLATGLGCADSGSSGEPAAESASAEEQFLGRWDVTVRTPEGAYPSWFELKRGEAGLTGSFVGRFGSARPIPSVEISSDQLVFSLPIQYEPHKTDLKFEGKLSEGNLSGTTNAEDGSALQWSAVPAPRLDPPAEPVWGEPIELFNGQDLSGWKARHPEAPNQWKAESGVLVNVERGADLVTEGEFSDFRLQLEMKYPTGSNSGVYLRGRYEVQIQDDFGKEPGSRTIGSVYGFLTPSANAAKEADQWQSYDITLLGRYITVVLNGQKVIDNQEIPGITGGALDSNEANPGPIMFQGDHGPISFRNIVLTPAN